MARRPRLRRTPGGNATATVGGERRAPFSTDTASYTQTVCSLACPLLTYYSSARPFSTTCSGQMAQTGLTDSATSPVIVLYSRALCARLCV